MGNAIIDNDLIDNKRMSVLTESPTNDDSGAFGILLNGDHTEVAHNRISGSDGFSYDYGRDGAAIEVYGGQYNSIHHNIANQNHAFTELGGSRSTGNVFAFNVVRSTLDTSGFVVTRGGANSRGPVTGTELYRNTVLLTAASSQGVICYGGCSPSILKMRGNIVVAQYRTLYVDRTVDQDYDLFAGSGSVNVATGPHTILANPIFTNAASGNLRLHETSPAVDRGTTAPFPTDADGVPAAQDGNGDGSPTPDVGAYERPASSGVTTTTTKQPTTTVPASSTVVPTTTSTTTPTATTTATTVPVPGGPITPRRRDLARAHVRRCRGRPRALGPSHRPEQEPHHRHRQAQRALHSTTFRAKAGAALASQDDMGNVDLRYKLLLGGKPVALVVAWNNRVTNGLAVFAVNDATGQKPRNVGSGRPCRWGWVGPKRRVHVPKPGRAGKYYAFVTEKTGPASSSGSWRTTAPAR